MHDRLKRDQWLGTLTQPFDLVAVAGTHGEPWASVALTAAWHPYLLPALLD